MEKDILAEAKDAFKACEDAEAKNRAAALDDLKFGRLGEQWHQNDVETRKKQGRPCLTINKQPAFIRQVVNDSRQNRPSIKVHPADSKADVKTADIMNGLIRNIEYTSNADIAYDTAVDFAASMGFGYLKVDLDYACDDTFDLDLKINRVANPFTIYGDPKSEKADSEDWNVAFETEMLEEADFTAQYPNAEKSNFNPDSRDEKDHLWYDAESIRVAKYWTRDKVQKNLLLLSDGQAVYEEFFLKPDPETGLTMKDLADAQGVTVIKERLTESYKVRHRIITGSEVIEDDEWAGRYIPIIPVYGEELNVEGERIFKSLIRDSKDAQRNFNYWRTAATELVALAPKAPYIGPKGAFKTDVSKWTTANTDTHSFIEFDGNIAPQRQPFAGVPAGALQEALNASDDMKAILGMYDASLGARSNETSGKAIIARQKEGDMSTFHIIDNMTRAIRHTGRILIDLIPHVYSEARVLRVMGEDMKPEVVEVNKPIENPDGSTTIYDLRAGKYDLTVTSGPSYTTRRQEAAEQMMMMIQSFPDAAPIIGGDLAKNLDWPGADKLAEKLDAISPLNKPQADPAQDPKVLMAKEDLNLKKMTAAQDAEIEREKMQLKREEAELNAEIKIREFKMNEEYTQKKHNSDIRMQREKMLDAKTGNMINVEGETLEQHPIIDMLGQLVQSNQVLSQAMNQMAMGMQQMAAAQMIPKNISMTTSSGKQITAQSSPAIQ